eukprot:gnl/TRDRNA2_/TRDRNA2_166577_c0_seq3.p1 gnl/TRDRNA2_/TRDRNA2_166577_c0~~gnl/TRDRNA2_/TRDRNA2_166577_c0_seq3.p1  ORF type:complete len:355 (+),score=24.12 gnl/TRDRNA2_/TRDRNA2_166577_c0_seq3:112-1176(+)
MRDLRLSPAQVAGDHAPWNVTLALLLVCMISLADGLPLTSTQPLTANFHEISVSFDWSIHSTNARKNSGCQNTTILTEVITGFQDSWGEGVPAQDIIRYAQKVLRSSIEAGLNLLLIHDSAEFPNGTDVCRHHVFSERKLYYDKCVHMVKAGLLRFEYFDTGELKRKYPRQLFPGDVRMFAALRHLEQHPEIDCVFHTDSKDVSVHYHPQGILEHFALARPHTNSILASRTWDPDASCEKMKMKTGLVQTRHRNCRSDLAKHLGEAGCTWQMDPGVVGGYRDAVLKYLQMTTEILACEMGTSRPGLDWEASNVAARYGFSDVFVFRDQAEAPEEYPDLLTASWSKNKPPFEHLN